MSLESSDTYHSDRSRLSSSLLKILLKDGPEKFKLHLDTPHVESTGKALIMGSLLHTLILEPHKVGDYVTYTGGFKRVGKVFEEFKLSVPGKTILLPGWMNEAIKLKAAYEALPTALRLLSGGTAEYTMEASLKGIPVKARADYINIEAGYICDIKSTAEPSGKDFFEDTIERYAYDLSAAFYCDIAHAVFNRYFDFYFIVISKLDFGCEIYKASSVTTNKGRTKYTHCLALYKHCMKTGVWAPPTRTDRSTADYQILEV